MRAHSFSLLRCAALAALASSSLLAADADLVRVDHYVSVKSMVPMMEGQTAQLYVREVTLPGLSLRSNPAPDRVVLFIHGAGTPAEVAFDVPYEDYSWMGYLARAGFDVFSMDMTGYGRSTRPTPMNDACNLATDQQEAMIPNVLKATCQPSYGQQMTTITSDWHDIDTVVDHIRALRGVDRVSLVGWSLGGPRAGGYASLNPQKVRSLVLLAPAYSRQIGANPPAKVPADGVAMNWQSRQTFIENWDRQVGCQGQYTGPAMESIWSEMVASDPVGATWGTGVRRAPSVTRWGWTQADVKKMQTPTLMVAGVHDAQVQPQSVRDFYEDLGSPQKVFIDLGCSSHNAMWEVNHQMLFEASRQWLTSGEVNGTNHGMLRMGYE